MSNLNRATNLNTTAAPLAGGMQNLSLNDKVLHDRERVINHAPIVEKEIINERPVEVRREHHVQPIIHEREHRIQPIIKTQATTERPLIEQDKNVMLAPIVERAAMPAGLEAVERAGPEGILHRAKLEKEVVIEHPVQIKHEHHVQPIIHEREHRIQPIVKTEVTAQQKHINTEKNVMLPPLVERAALPAGLEAVERAEAGGILHKAKLEKEIIVEHPVQVKHERHIQPIIHEREHHIQPIIKTEVTAVRPVIEQEREVLLPPIIEPTVLVSGPALSSLPANTIINKTGLEAERGLAHTHKHGADVHAHKHADIRDEKLAHKHKHGADVHTHKHADIRDEKLAHTHKHGADVHDHKHATTGTGHVSVGQKLKGALKEVQGTVTRNPAKKEEGKMLMHGANTTSATSTRI